MHNKFGDCPHSSEINHAMTLGSGANEIVMNRNTTDGMVCILNGLNFKAAEVILTTPHEHLVADSPCYITIEYNAVEVILTTPHEHLVADSPCYITIEYNAVEVIQLCPCYFKMLY